MMGEIVTRNVYSKAIAENKNAIVASCWTYFTTINVSVIVNAVHSDGDVCTESVFIYDVVKAIPLQAWTGFRFSGFLDDQHKEVVLAVVVTIMITRIRRKRRNHLKNASGK